MAEEEKSDFEKKVLKIQKDLQKSSDEIQDLLVSEIGEVSFDKVSTLSKEVRIKYDNLRLASKHSAYSVSFLGKLIEI